MAKLGCVRVFGMGLEYTVHRAAIHRYEPGSRAELGSSAGHRTDRAAIAATVIYELD